MCRLAGISAKTPGTPTHIFKKKSHSPANTQRHRTTVKLKHYTAHTYMGLPGSKKWWTLLPAAPWLLQSTLTEPHKKMALEKHSHANTHTHTADSNVAVRCDWLSSQGGVESGQWVGTHLSRCMDTPANWQQLLWWQPQHIQIPHIPVWLH